MCLTPLSAIIDSQNTHVLKGYGLTLTCDVDGLQASIDKDTDLMWTSRGEDLLDI